MANSRGVIALILSLGLTALISLGCERETERTTTTTTEATPSPAVGTSPSPAGAASPYASPTGSPVALTSSEKEFMTNAARGGALEVQLGNMAAQKASSPDVKQFGERMATDHGQLGQKLQQLASNLNVTPDQQLSPEQQSAVSRLQNLSGKAFDREYMKTMITDHVKDISEFQRTASQASNPDIRRFATEALPTLQEHLRMAREIGGKLGVKAAQ
jgi:putative membrane protein